MLMGTETSSFRMEPSKTFYGMVEVCECAPVAVSGWVLADRHDLAPCAANSLHRATTFSPFFRTWSTSHPVMACHGTLQVSVHRNHATPCRNAHTLVHGCILRKESGKNCAVKVAQR